METPLPYAGIAAETVQRITNAADALYEENGKSVFPNVDAVRRRARVNMNDASGVMRLWRRERSKAAAPLTTAIPAPVLDASQALLAALWKEATEAANANLSTAQNGWELERAEAEACREQLAHAFDGQSAELAVSQQLIDSMRAEAATLEQSLTKAATRAEALAQALHTAETKITITSARLEEIQQRAQDLKTAMEVVHSSAAAQQAETHRRLELTEGAVAQRDEQLRQREAALAANREELAHLRGQFEALLGRLTGPAPNGADTSPTKKRVSAGKSTPHNG